MKTEITFVGVPNIFRIYKGLGYEIVSIKDRETGEVLYEKDKDDIYSAKMMMQRLIARRGEVTTETF